MNSLGKPSVLFVYYTHTQQSLRVAEAMAGVLRERGCDVTMAGIEFTDPHYARKFDRFPFRHGLRDLLTVLPAQVRRATGQIRIPEAAREGDYDLVCLGSPTWFFHTNMPLRSYLKSAEAGKVLAGKRFAAYVVCRRYWSINLKEVRKLATAQGGAYTDGTKFQFAGGQIPSFLSLISYFGTGEMRERYLGVKIPPTNLQPGFAGQAAAFANKLADSLHGARPQAVPASPQEG
jgi:menaquinone-dependent protoporphyrinogen IX oxidase